MKTRLKLKPGQKGTMKLLAEYGDLLVCVRYRYDLELRKRFKTVEIIVDEKEWTPPPPRFADNARVPVRIAFPEEELKEKAKAAGGRWDPKAKLWFVPFGKIKGGILERHIVLDVPPKSAEKGKASNIKDMPGI